MPANAPEPIALIAALDYLARGWSTIPLCAPDHHRATSTHIHLCRSPGKAPIWKWSKYQHQHATESELRLAWTDNPNLNVGVIMGPISGLCGIDVDGAAGDILLDELSNGDLPPTVSFNTGGCEDAHGNVQTRYRLLYTIPPNHPCRTSGFQRDGIEVLKILGHGSQTVMPPSRHAAGGVYSWQAARSPSEIDVAEAPQWLLNQLANPAHPNLISKPSQTPQPIITPGSDDFQILEGARNNTLTAYAGVLRRHGANKHEILTFLTALNARCKPPLSTTELSKITQSVCRYTPSDLPKFETIVGYGLRPVVSNPELIDLPTVQVKPIDWLWKPWLPVGKLVAFDGDGGSGKSTVTLDIIARLTQGGRMPDGSPGWHEPINCIAISTEDDLEDTFKPKLLIAGAELSRVHYLTKVHNEKGELEPLMLPTHLSVLAELIQNTHSKLVVIDPLFAVWAGGDYFKATEVRKAMEALRDIARTYECTILFMRHFSKGSAGKGQASYRSEGSIAFNAAARVVINCGKHPTLHNHGILACAKNNLAATPDSLLFELQPTHDHCRIVWKSQTQITADDLAGESLSTQEGRDLLHDAIAIIQELCNDPSNPMPGKVSIQAIENALTPEGISPRTARRAAQQLGMTTERINGVRYRVLPGANHATD